MDIGKTKASQAANLEGFTGVSSYPKTGDILPHPARTSSPILSADLLKSRALMLAELWEAFGGRIYFNTPSHHDPEKDVYIQVDSVLNNGDWDSLLFDHVSNPRITGDSLVLPRTQKGPGNPRKIKRSRGERLFFETFDPKTRVTRVMVGDFDGGPEHADALPDAFGSACAFADRWRAAGASPLMLRSNGGHGFHVYVLIESAVDCDLLRRVALTFLPEDEQDVVEINPKNYGVTRAMLISAPWFGGSKPGNNEFIDPQTGDVIPLPQLEYLPTEIFNKLAAALPPLPELPTYTPVNKRDVPQRGRNAGYRNGDTEWERWKDRVRSDSRLLDHVYGAFHIPGENTARRGGWLAIMDPFRPDKRTAEARGGRAAYNIESGYYRCLGAHTAVDKASIFRMMIHLGQARDWQGCYELAEHITGIPRPARDTKPPSPRLKRIDALPPREPDGMSLEDARAELKNVLRKHCQTAIPGEVNVIAAGLGTGKTTAVVDGLKNHSLFRTYGGDECGRVLILEPSRELVEHVADMFRDELGNLPEYVGVYQSRSRDNCLYFKNAGKLGMKRQAISGILCAACKDKRLKTAQDGDPTIMEVEDCEYLRQRKMIQDKAVIIATYQAYAHSADVLKKAQFDEVVIDEDAQAALVDEFAVFGGDVDKWRARAEAQLDNSELDTARAFLDLLHRVTRIGDADAALIDGAGIRLDRQGMPLIPYLRAISSDADKIIGAMGEWARSRVSWTQGTKPTPVDSVNKDEVLVDEPDHPLRAVAELACVLAEEAAAGNPAATQARLEVRGFAGKSYGGIHCIRPKREVIDALKQSHLTLLDATASPDLYRLLFGDSVKVHEVAVREHYSATYFSDSRFSFAQLAVGDVPTRLQRHTEAVLKTICEQHRHPLIVVPKGEAENLRRELPPHVEITHWHGSDVRGSNRYTDCDALICLGHPRVSDTRSIWLAEALERDAAILEGKQRETDNDPHARLRMELPLVGYVGEGATGYTAQMSYPANDLARSLARAHYSSTVKQTIGRLRLAEQERGTRPLYLLIGEPLDSIRVDEVTTCQEWLEINNPAWWQAEEVSTMKIATPETLGILKTANETRANEARAKVERAVIALQEDGKRVSMRTVSAYTGLSRTTVNRYLSDVLKNSKPTVTLREPLYSISYNSPRSVTPLNEDLSSNHRPVTPPEDESCRSVTPSNDSRPVTPEATVPVVNTDPRAEEYPEDAEAWVEVLETVMQLSPNTGLLASLRALRCQGLRMEPQGDKYRLTYDSGRRCVIHTAEDAALECCALLYQHQAELTRLGVDVPTVDNQTEARARVRAVFGNGVMMEFEAITTTTGKEWVIVE